MREREKCFPVHPTRAGPAPVLVQHRAARPTAVATVFNLLPIGRSACARRARARAGHLMLAACSWTSLGAPRGPQRLHVRSPLCSSPLSPYPSHGRNCQALAVEKTRSHCAPLASPACPRAPPPSPAPLRQLTRRRTPCITLCPSIFAASAPRSPAAARPHHPLPELAEATVATAVSSSLFPP